MLYREIKRKWVIHIHYDFFSHSSVKIEDLIKASTNWPHLIRPGAPDPESENERVRVALEELVRVALEKKKTVTVDRLNVHEFADLVVETAGPAINNICAEDKDADAIRVKAMKATVTASAKAVFWVR